MGHIFFLIQICYESRDPHVKSARIQFQIGKLSNISLIIPKSVF
jgi:hypothetical protein